MFNIVRWLPGVTLILFHLEGIIDQELTCNSMIRNGLVYSDGVEKGYTSIPQDCDPTLQVLNISRNPIAEMNDKDLVNYPTLTELTMKELNFVKISANFFSPVANTFEKLDMSSSCFSSPFPKLPLGVKRIVASTIYKSCKNTLTLPSLVHLEFLNEFECRENNLDEFPALHPKAQIQFVDLSKNPMKNLTYSNVAPYCVLSQFNLFGTELSSKKYSDQCCGLLRWGDKYQMNVYLHCSSSLEVCPQTDFDATSISLYEECVRTPGSSFFTFDYYMLNIIIFLAVLLSISYLAYRFLKSEAMKRYQERESVRMRAEQEADEQVEEEHH